MFNRNLTSRNVLDAAFRSSFPLLAYLILGFATNVHAQQPFFMGLGDLPEEPFGSRGWAISGDGSTVVGSGNGNPAFTRIRAVRWTQSGGMVDLTTFPGGLLAVGNDSTAFAASSNGSCRPTDR